MTTVCQQTYFSLLDMIIAGVKRRLQSMSEICNIFSCLWISPSIDEGTAEEKAYKYAKDVVKDTSSKM